MMRFSFAALATLALAACSAVHAAPADRRKVDLTFSNRLQQRGVEVDLAGGGVSIKRGVDIDLGGAGVGIKKRDGALDGLNPLIESLGLDNADVTGKLGDTLNSLGLTGLGDALKESQISVSAANDEGVATVTIVGAGALDGVVLKVPVLASTGALAGQPEWTEAPQRLRQ
ncbi:hypothetical protein JCM10207_004274 [Rhodosporidiobolus poonsookiae]